MNTANIKSYAPKARRDFIQAVTEKAHLLGLSEKQIEPIEIKGDVAIIAGRPYPKEVGTIRQDLENRIRQDGFKLTMRKMAYTWFNRFVAIRYMELHDYLDHGYRVLSNRTGSEIPEILERAIDVELPGLNKEEVVRLSLAGNMDNELYQLLVVTQCNALSQAMPFLFEKIGGYTELLMPDNLLHSNSPIRNLVNDIPEEDWQQIEIIGWIYQFYISDKKDEVIGKVVKSEDIPAATQLFTPNWIVKYMVQNSLGAQWLATYPNSPLKAQMEYYIEPAEQTDEVKAQLTAITPNTLNPEELALIDPASGSGHILVEAYELFKAIYLERGYRQRDVAQLILEKNLFGLDIDGRAAQLTGFALMMKGRADDRRLFRRGVKLNVMALVDSTRFDAEGVSKGIMLTDYGLQPGDLTELKRLFEHATTFGSLIQVPERLKAKLPALKKLCKANRSLFTADALKRLDHLVRQAEILATRHDIVAANPPYMSSKGMNALLKKFAKDYFPYAKSDLFSCFIERGYTLAKDVGHNAMVTMQSWMFLSSYEKMREFLLQEKTICTMAHLGARAFGSISGEIVQTTVFVLGNWSPQGYKPVFYRLLDGGEEEKRTALVNGEHRHDTIVQGEFKKIPGSPLAYWVSDAVRLAFSQGVPLGAISDAAVGLQTGDNDLFLRFWFEVQQSRIGYGCADRLEARGSRKKWFPANKGGAFRRWYGNQEYVVNWEDDGRDIREDKLSKLAQGLCLLSNSKPKNQQYYFRSSVSWSDVTSGPPSFRMFSKGFIHDATGHSAFGGDDDWKLELIAYCNTKFFRQAAGLLNATLHFHVGYFNKLPFVELGELQRIQSIAIACIGVSQLDWNAYERSWDFQSSPS